MEHLGVAVLGVAVLETAVLGTGVLGVAVLGTTVLQPQSTSLPTQHSFTRSSLRATQTMESESHRT